MTSPDGVPVETVAGTLVNALRDHGIDRVFCVAGESYLPMLDRLYATPGVDVVTCRHEGSAGFAAVADAKLTGRAGVCLVSRAPGAANASIAVQAAQQDATPLLIIVGQVPRAELGTEAFQEADYARFLGGFAKEVALLLEPSRAAEAIARLLHVAESGTPGAVVLAVPEDVFESPDSARPRPSQRLAEPVADVDAVARLLASAERPLIIAGALAGSAAGRRVLQAVAERHVVPVVTSNKRQDLFDNRHPLYAGHLHNNTPARQRAELGQADLVIAVGTRLEDITTRNRQLPRPRPDGPALVHVYPDPDRLGRTHPPTVGLACDPVAVLRQLAALASTGSPRRAEWAAGLNAIETEKAVWAPHPSEDGIAFGAVVAALDEVTGGDLTVTVDSGTFTSWLYRYLRFSGSGRLLGISSSAMGFGVPAGLAAALRQKQPAVVVVGDGGFLMTGSELATAVSRQAPLVVVVADNGSYGTIRLHQETRYPGRTIATDLCNPDFVRLAEAYGALGLRIDDEASAPAVLAKALAHGGPVVVHVPTSLDWITAYRRLRPREKAVSGLGGAA